MKQPLTKIQKLTLNYLISFHKKNGYMPSIEEMGKYFRRAIVSIWERLDALQKKGWIKRKKNGKRWIVVL